MTLVPGYVCGDLAADILCEVGRAAGEMVADDVAEIQPPHKLFDTLLVLDFGSQ